MKESSGKTKKLSKGVRRARSMRNVVMMVLVCVLMLSAATYAWFTLSNTAKVANMTMTVGKVTGLQIAPDHAANADTDGIVGKYGSSLVFGDEYEYTDTQKNVTYDIKGDLLPATMVKTTTLKKPIYATDGSGKVKGIEDLATGDTMYNDGVEDKTYFAYKTHFYLKVLGNEDYEVKLADRTGNLTTAGVYADGITGSYILNKDNTNTFIGADAVRICLKVQDPNFGDQTIIYSSNSKDNQNGTVAEMETNYLGTGTTVESPTNTQKADGTFDKNQSFKLTAGKDVRVEMTIWIEGTDVDCANQMSLETIRAQIQFVKVE